MSKYGQLYQIEHLVSVSAETDTVAEMVKIPLAKKSATYGFCMLYA